MGGRLKPGQKVVVRLEAKVVQDRGYEVVVKLSRLGRNLERRVFPFEVEAD